MKLLVLIDIDKIQESRDLRAYRDESFEDILTRDIESEGQVVPILVRNLGNGRFEALDLTRFRIVRSLGYDRVECRVLHCGEKEGIIIALKMNLLRKSHDAMGVAKTLKLLRDKYKMRVIDLAVAFHFSKGHVSKLLKLNKLSLEDQDALARGELTIEQGYARVLGKIVPLPERVERGTRACGCCGQHKPFEEVETTAMCRSCRFLLAETLEKQRVARKRLIKKRMVSKDQHVLSP